MNPNNPHTNNPHTNNPHNVTLEYGNTYHIPPYPYIDILDVERTFNTDLVTTFRTKHTVPFFLHPEIFKVPLPTFNVEENTAYRFRGCGVDARMDHDWSIKKGHDYTFGVRAYDHSQNHLLGLLAYLTLYERRIVAPMITARYDGVYLPARRHDAPTPRVKGPHATLSAHNRSATLSVEEYASEDPIELDMQVSLDYDQTRPVSGGLPGIIEDKIDFLQGRLGVKDADTQIYKALRVPNHDWLQRVWTRAMNQETSMKAAEFVMRSVLPPQA